MLDDDPDVRTTGSCWSVIRLRHLILVCFFLPSQLQYWDFSNHLPFDEVGSSCWSRVTCVVRSCCRAVLTSSTEVSLWWRFSSICFRISGRSTSLNWLACFPFSGHEYCVWYMWNVYTPTTPYLPDKFIFRLHYIFGIIVNDGLLTFKN